MTKSKDQTIDLGIFWWRDVIVSSDEDKVRGIEDLPLQESVGRVKKRKGLFKLIQNKCRSKDVRKDDEVTDIPTKWIERGIVVRLKVKKEQPKKGIQVYEVEI